MEIIADATNYIYVYACIAIYVSQVFYVASDSVCSCNLSYRDDIIIFMLMGMRGCGVCMQPTKKRICMSHAG